MFSKDNVIEFKADKFFIENNKDIYPVPSLLNIPEWFKKLKHSKENSTVKGCMPFLDAITAGYIIKNSSDFILHKEGKKTYIEYALKENNTFYNINAANNHSEHNNSQLEGSPLIKKNKMDSFLKIYNPWVIKTPPGYSSLFVNPLNNSDDRFEAIAGIVDTDVFPAQVNFPIVLNSDKYPNDFKHFVKRGTPIVQVIPFKRENWKMKIVEDKIFNLIKFMTVWHQSFMARYKDRIWKRKKWR
tara:strand:+ start:1685 stop:2413 length:729 start_codon:yes stop_codon:yes gene_type:complete